MTTTTGRTRPYLYSGLILTALLALAPLIDIATADTIADHVREAYPHWSAGNVEKDRNAIAIYLAAVGVLGTGGWLWTIRSLARRPERAYRTATIMFVLGACVALFDLTYGSEQYDRTVPLLYGLLGLIPLIPGTAAVVLLWRDLPRGSWSKLTAR
ncbi:MAG TPA: hypothetical protein VHC49_18735 [Mycobacteriales bacterium]|nr:hypothetical protein [Mycobacteriales bacterium]